MKILMAIMIVVALVDATLGASVGQPETYDNGLAGWVAYDTVNQKIGRSLTVENAVLRLRYGSQSMPAPPEEHIVRADASASGARFVGDYIVAGITAFAFRIKPDPNIRVQVLIENSDARRRWRYDVSGLPADEWSTVTIPLNEGSVNAVHSGGTTDQFLADLQNVTWIGVLVIRGSSMAEQITFLDDMRMIGPGQDFAVWMAQSTGNAAWQVEMLPDGDFDGDGMMNLAEFIAGTDAADAQDVLSLEAIGMPSAAGVEVRWRSTAGRIYRVLRASHLRGSFSVIKDGLDGDPPENRYLDESAVGMGPWFYKIEVTKADELR